MDETDEFEDVVAGASALYRPGSLQGGPARNAVIKAWAQQVGRDRAVRAMEGMVARYGSRSAAARALTMSPRTFLRLEELFAELPRAAQPEGLMLYFRSRLRFVNQAVVQAVVASIVGDTSACTAVYSPHGSGSVVRLSGLSDPELLALADGLLDFFAGPLSTVTSSIGEHALLPHVERAVSLAVERSLPDIVSRAIAPMAVLHAQLGERLVSHIRSVYSGLDRTEVQLSPEVVARLRTMEADILDIKLASTGWRMDGESGALIRDGAWALATGVAGNSLYEALKWIFS